MQTSQEAVDFQPQSGLYPALVAVCSSAIDVVNKLQIKTDARIRNALRKNEFAKNVADIIKEYLGYNLPVIVFPCDEPMVAVINTVSQKYYFDLGKDLKDLHLGMVKKGDRPLHALKYGFAQIAQGIDDKTGIVSPQASKKILGRILIGTSVFRLKDATGREDFTAAELASLILHETGHVVDLGQIAGWFYYRSSLLDHIESTFDGTPSTPDELKEILTVLTEQVKSFPPSPDNGRLKDAIDKANAALQNNSLSPTNVSKLEQAIKVISVSVYAKRVAEKDTDIIRKYGDVTTTRNNEAYRERMADDFAVKYGAGVPLNSALAKLHMYVEMGKHTDVNSVPYMFRFMAYTLGAIKTLSASLDMSACDITDGYDGSLDRLKRNLSTMHQVFRKDLDDKELDFFIDQVKAMETEVDAYANESHVRKRESIYAAVSNLCFVLSSVTGIMSDKVDTDYKNLYDITESLIRSPLYYHISRVRRLLRNA